ncbi:speckle-type POZ protein B-like [Rhizophagus clarus]|uniref:Speckle-type POZ protein B-like n=1 Tax=Rhizophagus clarus TaxID=94130 RepID=A0A8H3MG05_9GLOM|nr:speckle-type POZ protein B-like [Rhizophagus clarus]
MGECDASQRRTRSDQIPKKNKKFKSKKDNSHSLARDDSLAAMLYSAIALYFHFCSATTYFIDYDTLARYSYYYYLLLSVRILKNSYGILIYNGILGVNRTLTLESTWSFSTCFKQDQWSKDPSVLKSVQNKARQLSQQLNISQPDIVEFLDNQELIIAQNQEEHDPSYARAIGRSSQFLYKISKDFENLYEEDKFKDVTIKVDNKAFKGHFSILYARSPFFREILPKHGTYGEISIPKITANSFEVYVFWYDLTR